MSRVLVIEDEESIRRVLRLNLEGRNYQVSEAPNAAEGLRQLGEFKPSIVILDLGLPDKNGLEVLKEIREWSTVPIIVLTVNDNEKTKVELLEAGADDYITKPFGPLELLARIHVALRHRGVEVDSTPVFESGNLKVDIPSRTVLKDGQPVHLTATEMNLLKALIRGGGQVVHQDHVLKEVWGPGALDNPHYLRIYIGLLRKKLEANPTTPRHILTEPGVGYRLV
ncbi:MAG: response regulator [Bdellovibrionales bacterium]|nr:response regulator [Bdellovibrionales bacterium]